MSAKTSTIKKTALSIAVVVSSLVSSVNASDFPPIPNGDYNVVYKPGDVYNPITGVKVNTSRSSVIEVPLKTGWNLVSLAGYYTKISLNDLFPNTTNGGFAVTHPVEAVYAFDADKGIWVSFRPYSRSNTLTEVSVGQGLFILCNSGAKLTFDSTVPIEGVEKVKFDDNLYNEIKIPTLDWF